MVQVEGTRGLVNAVDPGAGELVVEVGAGIVGGPGVCGGASVTGGAPHNLSRSGPRLVRL